MASTVTAPLGGFSQIRGARVFLIGLTGVVLIGALSMTGVLTQARDLIPGLKVSTPTYQTTTVAAGNVAVTVTATGPVSAVNNLPLSFKESGRLAELKA